jgi:hypothetical protein
MLDVSEVRGPLQVIGYDWHSQGSPVEGDGRVIDFGERADLTLYLKVTDRIGLSGAVVSVGIPGLFEGGDLSDLFRGASPSIGEVLEWDVSLHLTPAPTREKPLPFFRAQDYHLEFSLSNALGGSVIRQVLLTVTISPIAGATDSSFCISGNQDIRGDRRLSLLEGMDFPYGPPAMNSSGNGDIRSEITDGIFTGSEVPNWESVSWDSDWGPDLRGVDIRFAREVFVETVVAICPTPYLNHRADSVDVAVSLDGESFEKRGKAVALWERTRRGIQAIVVRDVNASTRTVRLTLSHANQAQRIVLSEVYVFGR